jgi:hypothetical protein
MERETVRAKLTALYEVDNERQRNDQLTDQETRVFISG